MFNHKQKTMEVQTKNVVIAKGKEFDNFSDAILHGTKSDLKDFCEQELFYDHKQVTYDFLIEHREKLYHYLKTILNFENKLEND